MRQVTQTISRKLCRELESVKQITQTAKEIKMSAQLRRLSERARRDKEQERADQEAQKKEEEQKKHDHPHLEEAKLLIKHFPKISKEVAKTGKRGIEFVIDYTHDEKIVSQSDRQGGLAQLKQFCRKNKLRYELRHADWPSENGRLAVIMAWDKLPKNCEDWNSEVLEEYNTYDLKGLDLGLRDN